MVFINSEYKIKKITRNEAKPFIMNLHYAKRMPSVSYAFGLFETDVLIGVLTIGKPASHQLCIGICGKGEHQNVYELNRLIVSKELPKNTLSFFVGGVMRMLAGSELILVSYADEGMGHHGYIYQATNWWYTGKTPERTDKYTPKGRHSRHYDDTMPHLRKVRTSKHRYVYVPSKRKRKQIKEIINYPIHEEYPKGDNEYYELGDRMKTEIINRKTGEVFYE